MAYLAGLLGAVLLLLFGSLLFAVFLTSLAERVSRWTSLSKIPSVLIVLLLLTLATVGTGWLLGPTIAEQARQLGETIPAALADLREIFPMLELPDDWRERVVEQSEAILSGVTNVLTATAGAFSAAFLVLVIGTYLALGSEQYRSACVAVVPPKGRARARELLETLDTVLARWLLGRFASMAAVGVLTTTGLWVMQIPLALALGLIAALLSFVPFVGPIVSAVPAIIVALNKGPEYALYVAIAYVVVQALEGNLITPLIEQRAVSLPPAALMAAQLIMGALFGIIGVLIATPIFVTLVVLVQFLYIQETLEENVTLLGDH